MTSRSVSDFAQVSGIIGPSCRKAGDDSMRKMCSSQKKPANPRLPSQFFVRFRLSTSAFDASPDIATIPATSNCQQRVRNRIQTSHLNRSPQCSIAVKHTSTTSPSISVYEMSHSQVSPSSHNPYIGCVSVDSRDSHR
jgi:hypothetical protein